MCRCQTHIEGDHRERDGAFSGPATAAGERTAAPIVSRSMCRSQEARSHVTSASRNGLSQLRSQWSILIGSILMPASSKNVK